jgi:hypothetical protein
VPKRHHAVNSAFGINTWCVAANYDYELKEILPRVQGPLRELLDREISSGNSIVQISGGWPMRNANVWLARRFHQDYTSMFPGLAYSYFGDPKNWIEEYVDAERSLMVAVSTCAWTTRAG